MSKIPVIKLREVIDPGVEPYYRYKGTHKKTINILKELDFMSDSDGLFNYYNGNGQVEEWIEKLHKEKIKVKLIKICPDAISMFDIEQHLKDNTDYAKDFYNRKDFGNVRISSYFKQVDNVLGGGGFVENTIILLGGEPGSGKSTLATQIALKLSHLYKILYVSSEELVMNNKYRFTRLLEKELTDEQKQNIIPFSTPDMDIMEARIKYIEPDIAIFDSVNAFKNSSIGKRAGTVSQVNSVAEFIKDYHNLIKPKFTIMICHVNKSKEFAGPKDLQHLVDVTLMLEGTHGERMLRSDKNRYGDTSEIGVLTMGEKGFKDIDDYEPIDDAPENKGVEL